MNVLVFDVPAEHGGALTILQEYYKEALLDKSKTWLFVVSLPELQEAENVKIIRIPWIKKSWFHRLYFDHFVAHKLIKKYKADEIISLQNVIIPKVKVPQTLYVHHPLPFIDYRFKMKENFKFWVYQNLIGKTMIKSIKKANRVIVQTNWMKTACIERANVKPEKITIDPPEIKVEIKQFFEQTQENLRTFFYPSHSEEYKNHKVIVDAAMLLKGQQDYKIIFTLNGNENKNIIELYNQVKENNLPIQFIGRITLEQVYEYFSKSVLIFPSYIETFGLPMLEAKMHKAPVLASDCLFSHEILDGYEGAKFFKPHDAVTLAGYINNNL